VAAVCWCCIGDEYLKSIIRENGTLDECSLCGGTSENSVGPAELAEIEGLRRSAWGPGKRPVFLHISKRQVASAT